MITATSFLNHLGSRPPRYRTPSPPRRAVEPISPCSTSDLRASWVDRNVSRVAASDRDHFLPHNPTHHHHADETASHRSSHGRSGSTIDALATIALATSPTFAPLSYRPPSQNSTPAMSLFPSEPTESTERPNKRPRSEKDPSPYMQHRTVAVSDANSASLFDSMKTDAELLLNLARPTNFHPPSHSAKRVSVDESFYHYGDEQKHHVTADSGGASWRFNDEKYAYSAPGPNSMPSRVRSQSDGSAAISRPVIHGVRPNTSSSTLPPILWQEEGDAENDYSPAKFTINGRPSETQTQHSMHTTNVAQMPIEHSSKIDDEAEESNQASCAACNLVRIPMDTGEQGDVTWISCDGCKRWFHIVCAGFKSDRELRTVDKFICRECRPIYGQTTFVRKSSRARTAIDYAGLNQGLVKAATDSLEHHYIEPIRQGKIQFLPENFPRMRPELVTAEYFERGNGMTEPIVIPAEWNTRESVSISDSEFDALVQEAPTQEMFDELLDHVAEQEESYEQVIDCGQDQLDMVIPEGLTVRRVAELYGPEERVEVIDVKSQQNEDKRWTMQKWAEYYESTGDKVVRNVISLEVSQSPLGKLIRRPKVVRDLDLQDSVWPEEQKAVGDCPKVQFYVLMSVADCYTDFHIDFGGSSVYYHILKGKKTFFFIPPKDKHLKKYEEWCNSPAQDSTFLGDQTKECYRVDLSEGDTMLIPSGWIHAVWTPENSLVVGGNFLTRLNYGMQIKIAQIEKDTKVPRKFRYPFFQKIQWYTALRYLEDDPLPQSVLDAFAQDENYRFHRAYPIYYEFGERTNNAPAGSPYHNSRFYSQAELEGLPDLAKYLYHTALIAGAYLTEGVTMDTRNAVKRSIPKMSGEPIDAVRKFGIWVAWKRGNERAPHWTRPGVAESNAKLSLAEKKPAGRPSRRSERNAESQRTYAERQAVQRLPEPAHDPATESSNSSGPSGPLIAGAAIPDGPSSSGIKEEPASKSRAAPRGSGLGPKRVACDACRKRRIRCHHKDEHNDGIISKQTAVTAFGPSNHSLAHDAASALNSLAAIASEAGFQDNGSGRNPDRFEVAAKFNSAILGTPRAPVNGLGLNDASPEGANTGKKGRSKACDDCRKSKRRCIHDEYGRIDPVKAQERAKPRAAASAKRPRINEEGTGPMINKRMKQESTSPTSRPAHLSNSREAGALGMQDAHMPDHVHAAVDLQAPFSDAPLVDKDANRQSGMTVGEKEAPLGPTSYASPPTFQTDTVDAKELNSAPVSKPTATLVSPPTSLADETDVPQEQADGEGDHVVVLHTPTSSSRHSSRQPRQVDRYMPETHVSKPTKGTTHTPTVRRSSFGGSSGGVRKSTPGPSSGSKKSASRPSSSSHAKKSFWSTDEKKGDRHAATSTSPGQPGKNSKRVADEEPDAESLRLIRELQEAEFGLRKRSTRV
ncbi:[Histone H3]-lysine-36 demethylase [Aspergillus vadensis CBS 113365]|uniref:JmjC domain-containing histone demethylation protein 1 n=1 Tax=Aspergillus vadensis (strain CBS 113365 / IMI 142717 / IBT 24658) TaxID=1448311 RepID=A0A319BSH5_ASPVC|nr:JmjC domain-containing histone demethylation protein 1 [Aspergillus vadensis CBS 113365]PYH68793.1 JmjC domain-containing histone demethylation protein 1 [Aspergillus vadensis CBS 113365]